MFMGTPHDGSELVKKLSPLRRVTDTLLPSKVVDTDGQLLDALQGKSETLQNITDMFAPLMKHFRIYFLWEQEKTDCGISHRYVGHRPIHVLRKHIVDSDLL